MGFEPTISVFEGAKTFRALDRESIGMGTMQSCAFFLFFYKKRYDEAKSFVLLLSDDNSLLPSFDPWPFSYESVDCNG
jgi:hypothetical protein